MNMKTILLTAVLGFSVLGSVLSFASGNDERDESPVEVYVAPTFECYTGAHCVNLYNWTITALEEGVSVKKLIINRGTCQAQNNQPARYLTRELRYGESVEYKSVTNATLTECKPLEGVVVTNKGTWTFDLR